MDSGASWSHTQTLRLPTKSRSTNNYRCLVRENFTSRSRKSRALPWKSWIFTGVFLITFLRLPANVNKSSSEWAEKSCYSTIQQINYCIWRSHRGITRKLISTLAFVFSSRINRGFTLQIVKTIKTWRFLTSFIVAVFWLPVYRTIPTGYPAKVDEDRI